MANKFEVDATLAFFQTTFVGTAGAEGSTTLFSTIGGPGIPDWSITDFDEDGRLDYGVDTLDNSDGSGAQHPFSGYVTVIDGVTCPIFAAPGDIYCVAIPQSVADLVRDIMSDFRLPFYPGDTEPNIGPGNDTGTDVYLCFAEGMRIAPPNGDVAVEALCIGDHVRTFDGRITKVLWIGRQTVAKPFADPGRRVLVEIRAGALGDVLQLRDLRVTADHALLLDGLLVYAGALINGGSIDWVPGSDLPDSYTIYHVEIAEHDVILAEGVAAETFIDYAGRQRFDNFSEYLALYDRECVIPEAEYPRISAARQVPPALRQRLGLITAA